MGNHGPPAADPIGPLSGREAWIGAHYFRTRFRAAVGLAKMRQYGGN